MVVISDMVLHGRAISESKEVRPGAMRLRVRDHGGGAKHGGMKKRSSVKEESSLSWRAKFLKFWPEM